jgi:hypothetical protein
MTKLYHKVSRFLVRRRVNRRREKILKWAMTLQPGDIINDCTSFNVRILDIDYDIRQTGRGWYIINVDFKVTPYGGGCSLIHCGVTPAWSREKVEREWLAWAEQTLKGEYLAEWYGSDKAAFDAERERISKKVDVLKNGGHITNELGMILKEYCSYPDSYKE